MTKTNRDELKGNNNNELPCMVNGSQSSTRGDEKAIVRVADSDVENKDKSSSGTVAKDSEPGKLQGQHVAERVGRVPMRKRGTMVPYPSPRKLSGGRGISEHRPKINHVSKLHPMNNNSGHDFSRMALLADVACNLSNDRAPVLDCLPAKEPVVQQQDVSTMLPHAVDSTDHVVQGKNETVAPQKSSFGLADEKGTEHIMANVGGMVVATKGASGSENLAPDSGVFIKSEKSSASEPTVKKNLRLHWDLNVPMEAWGPPCDVEDDASEKDVKGAITNPMPPRESEPIDGSRDHLDGFVVSAEQKEFSSPCGPTAEAAARDDNEFKYGDTSPLEDGELREPYHWRKNEFEDGESEPEDEGFYRMAESNDNKMKDSGKRIFGGTKSGPLRIGEAHGRRDREKNVGACMNDLHLKKRSSSSSRRFGSHDAIPRTRTDDYEELSMDPYNSSGRHDRSSGRGYSSGSGSRPRYVLESPHHDDLGMMDAFDQSGPWSGQGSQPDGYVRKRFSNGGYRGGRGRRFSNGEGRGSRGRHGGNNQFSGRRHNGMSGNRRGSGNAPVFRRSRSRSPVQWNGNDGFRAEERMMERARFPFQKGFLEDQETGFISPPGFTERRSYDSGANHNSFRGRRSGLVGQRHDAGSSLRRLNSDYRNYIPFGRQRRFDSVEDSTGGNKFEMRQQQTGRDDVTEDGGDDVPGFSSKRVCVCSQQQQRRR